MSRLNGSEGKLAGNGVAIGRARGGGGSEILVVLERWRSAEEGDPK